VGEETHKEEEEADDTLRVMQRKAVQRMKASLQSAK
jgi:hypothetical protein